jgi:hypothetical protein
MRVSEHFHSCVAGLPDVIFLKPKIPVRVNFGRAWQMEDIGILYLGPLSLF